MLATDLFMLTFRFVHIVGGVLWVGSAFLFSAFMGPSVGEVGPSAGPLMHAMVKKRKVAKVITGLATANVLAGWIMWLRYADKVGWGDWLGSRFGFVITLGAIVATIAWYVGFTGVGRNVERLVDLGDEMAAADGPPSPERVATMQRVQASLEKHSKLDLLLLLVAVTAMATARYW